MDIPQKYIKMCDHEKVQDGWELKPGDIIYSPWYPDCLTMALCECKPFYRAIDHKGGVVSFGKEMEWTALPRQEDIQGWLQDIILWYDLCKRGPSWHIRTYGGEMLSRQITLQGETPEQCLLMAYFHEAHGLTWDGERWIDATNKN